MRVDIALNAIAKTAAHPGERDAKDLPEQPAGGFGEALAAKEKKPTAKRLSYDQSGDRTGGAAFAKRRSTGSEHLAPLPATGPRQSETVVSLHDLIAATTTLAAMPIALLPDSTVAPAHSITDLPSAETAEPILNAVAAMPDAAILTINAGPSYQVPRQGEKAGSMPPAHFAAGIGTDTPSPTGAVASPSPATQSTNTAGLRAASTAPRPDTPMIADRAGETQPPRVAVLGFNTVTAPVQPGQLTPTAAGLVAAIEGEPAWRAAASEAIVAMNRRGQAHHSVSTLRIQLNPAELGMVTARLVANDSQLGIEIQVESNDARHRLASDSDAIVKALRAVGYDIDKVTIQQMQSGTGAPAQQGGPGREWSAQEQGQGRSEANAGGHNERDGTGEQHKSSGHGTGATVADHAGSGVYI